MDGSFHTLFMQPAALSAFHEQLGISDFYMKRESSMAKSKSVGLSVCFSDAIKGLEKAHDEE